MPLTRDEDVTIIAHRGRTIAVFGCSDRPDRPSYGVAAFLQRHGYGCCRSIRRSPASMCTASRLARAGTDRVPIDIVDIFRRPIAAGEAVDQAIAVGAKPSGCSSASSTRKRRHGGSGRPEGRHGPLHKIEIMRLGLCLTSLKFLKIRSA